MEYISIRSLQHYLYCPHRWGLIEIDRAWAENVFVVKGNAVHERVHSGGSYSLRGRKRYTNLDIWNDELGLIGKTDCLEQSKEGYYYIVEYKPTKPKKGQINHSDAMQLFAQKLCVDKLFNTDCIAEVFYSDVKQRVQISFEPSFLAELKTILSEMRLNIAEGVVPKIPKGQRCSGCSMKEICMPQIKSNTISSIRNTIWEE